MKKNNTNSPYVTVLLAITVQFILSCSGINPQGSVTANPIMKSKKDVSFIDENHPSDSASNRWHMDKNTEIEHEKAELLDHPESPVADKTIVDQPQVGESDKSNGAESGTVMNNGSNPNVDIATQEEAYNELKDEKKLEQKDVSPSPTNPKSTVAKTDTSKKIQSSPKGPQPTTDVKPTSATKIKPPNTKSKINMANWTRELNQTRTELSRVQSLTAVTLRDLSVEENLFTFNSKSKISVASNFKIYVLKSLVEGIKQKRFTWSTKVTVKSDLKSFPSGVVQNWGSGTQTTVKQLAKLMISISDNSATDHLIDLIGRDHILKSMEEINSFTLLNTPFLSTMEWFRMKTLNRTQVSSYQKMGVEGKKTYIKNLNATLPRSEVPGKWYGWTASRPKEIKNVEWFASTEDLCLTYRAILDYVATNKELLEILKAKTPFGLSLRDLNANYLGCKGGNETGVLTMSFLLKAKSGRWACLSVGVNDEDRPVNYTVVNPIFKRLILLSSRIINSKKP